jgi:aryl-alcohol dehydrogenase-like predicted oxidoreductase
MAKKPSVAPIPGSRKPGRISENLGAADVELNAGEFAAFEAELALSTAIAPIRTSQNLECEAATVD